MVTKYSIISMLNLDFKGNRKRWKKCYIQTYIHTKWALLVLCVFHNRQQLLVTLLWLRVVTQFYFHFVLKLLKEHKIWHAAGNRKINFGWWICFCLQLFFNLYIQRYSCDFWQLLFQYVRMNFSIYFMHFLSGSVKSITLKQKIYKKLTCESCLVHIKQMTYSAELSFIAWTA